MHGYHPYGLWTNIISPCMETSFVWASHLTSNYSRECVSSSPNKTLLKPRVLAKLHSIVSFHNPLKIVSMFLYRTHFPLQFVTEVELILKNYFYLIFWKSYLFVMSCSNSRGEHQRRESNIRLMVKGKSNNLHHNDFCTNWKLLHRFFSQGNIHEPLGIQEILLKLKLIKK